MTRSVRRRPAVIAFAVALVALMLGSSSPASAANPTLPIDWKVDATTTLKSLNQTVVVPTGSFTGSVDLTTWDLTGNLSLPPATTQMKIGSLPLASATFEMVAAGPITGHVDLATGTVNTTASFNVRIRSVKPLGLPLNLVGNNCRTATPVTSNLSGPFSLTASSTFTATYTMPKLKDCGFFITPILNLIIPGPGNTLSATFGPKA